MACVRLFCLIGIPGIYLDRDGPRVRRLASQESLNVCKRGVQFSTDGPGADRQPRRDFLLSQTFPEAEDENIPLIVRDGSERSLMVNALVHVQPVRSVVFRGVKLCEPGNPSVVVLDA